MRGVFFSGYASYPGYKFLRCLIFTFDGIHLSKAFKQVVSSASSASQRACYSAKRLTANPVRIAGAAWPAVAAGSRSGSARL